MNYSKPAEPTTRALQRPKFKASSQRKMVPRNKQAAQSTLLQHRVSFLPLDYFTDSADIEDVKGTPEKGLEIAGIKPVITAQ